MDYISLLFYPALLALLFWKAKPVKHNEWNDGFMSREQTKALLGFCSVVIMFHHMSQKTCASWLPDDVTVHGLDGFLNIGYLTVALFFFCSGYGIFKSYKTKEHYFENFFINRAFPILLMGFMSGTLFFTARSLKDVPFSFRTIISIGGPSMLNEYGWYVIMILALYYLFYLGFYRAKKDIGGIIVVAAGTLALMVFCDYFIYGTWWYNTLHLFLIGIIFAANEEKIIAVLKKKYLLILCVGIIVTVIGFLLGNYLNQICDLLGKTYVYGVGRWISFGGQAVSGVSFTIVVMMLGMKIRIGNFLLDILGKMTLETYLVHGLFVQLFGYSFVVNTVEPLIYIKNVSLYVLVVMVCSLPLAFGCKWLGNVLCEINYTFLSRRYEAIRNRFMKTLAIIIVGFVVYCAFAWLTWTSRNEQKDEIITKYAEDHLVYANLNGAAASDGAGSAAASDGSESAAASGGSESAAASDGSESAAAADGAGRKMAAYVVGEGNHTVVMLGDYTDPLCVATLRPIADGLADKGNKVIIFQYPGRLYSDAADSPRTTKQYAEDIHNALHSLGENGPYILWAHVAGGMYAMEYINLYPDEVEGYVGADTYVGAAIHEIGEQYSSFDELKRYAVRSATQNATLQKLLDYTNLTIFGVTDYNEMVFYKHTKEEKELIGAVFGRYVNSPEMVEDEKMFIDNMLAIENVKIPDNIPALYILSYAAVEDDCICENWQELHEATFTNPDIQKIVTTAYNPYFVFFNYPYPLAQTQEFIEALP